MSAAPMRAGYVRARRAVPVLVDRPLPDGRTRRFAGRLLGAMYDRGVVHHYRVVDETDGQLYLTPPHWLADTSAVLEPATVLAEVSL